MTQAPNSLCDVCNAAGLPILPVRYVPVPKSVSQTLPAWATAERVKSVQLSSEFHYALRTLRTGYVYLFYAKHVRGANLWECYSVTEDGCLVKAPDVMMAPSQPQPTVQCSRQGHSNVRLHHLVIERPEKCGTTWIAFTEHKWSADTVQTYTTDAKLRSARMQAIEPAAMAKGTRHSHGVEATAAALEDVLEYATAFSTAWLPHDSNPGVFSQPDGTFDAARLPRVCTRYPWHQRQGQAAQAVKAMLVRAKKGDGSHHTPQVFALWDAVGMAHELNGYRNDAAGWLKQYGDERELEISGLNAIDAVHKALERQINDGYDRLAKNTAQMPDFEESSIRTRAVMRYAKGNPSDLGKPLYELDEKFKANQIDEKTYKRDRTAIINQYSSDPAAMQAEYAKIDQHRSDLKAARTTNLAKAKKDGLTRSWDSYEDHLDRDAIKQFRGAWSALLAKADALIDERTQGLIAWLEAPLFVDALEDFRPNNIVDGVTFEDVIGNAIFGINSSKSGAKKLAQWVAQTQGDLKQNIVWRAIALNQHEGMASISHALKEADEHKAKRTVADALTVEGYLTKTLKGFADTFKKAVSVSNSNTSASSEKGSWAFGVKLNDINTRGTDKVAITVGEFVFRQFKVNGMAEFVSEKIIQHVFAVRAFVTPADSLKLIVQQAKDQKVASEAILQRLRSARAFLEASPEAFKAAQSSDLAHAWEHFKNTHKDGPIATRDARLAVVVMLIEGFNFQKLLAECYTKGDAKTWWSLAASSMSIASALFDIASVPAKALFKPESWSYQQLKLSGGLLSSGATVIGAVFDWVDAGKADDKGQSRLAALYYAKAFFGGIGGLLTFGTTLTYAAPLIERLTGRAVVGLAMRSAGAWATELIATRILLMAAGTWITVGVFGIQCFIWAFSDNKLQEWCTLCVFGTKRKAKDAYKTPKQQQESFEAALVDVGLAA